MGWGNGPACQEVTNLRSCGTLTGKTVTIISSNDDNNDVTRVELPFCPPAVLGPSRVFFQTVFSAALKAYTFFLIYKVGYSNACLLAVRISGCLLTASPSPLWGQGNRGMRLNGTASLASWVPSQCPLCFNRLPRALSPYRPSEAERHKESERTVFVLIPSHEGR